MRRIGIIQMYPEQNVINYYFVDRLLFISYILYRLSKMSLSANKDSIFVIIERRSVKFLTKLSRVI